jgi:hypothetical protein
MTDAAAAAYLALSVDGTDVLLMGADHALRRELSRRIREDLIRLGTVQAGPVVRIADGTQASGGTWSSAPRTTTRSRRGSRAGRWPTVTCSASRLSPRPG